MFLAGTLSSPLSLLLCSCPCTPPHPNSIIIRAADITPHGTVWVARLRSPCPGGGPPYSMFEEVTTMTITTIFYSYSGVTRGIAEKIQKGCGGDLVEVTAVKPYSSITAYSKGCYRAMKGEADAVKPAAIDVSGSDLIVIGTPVWAFRAAPPVNGAVQALIGCEGKTAVIFATCGADAKDTLTHLEEALTAKGVQVRVKTVLDKNDVQDAEKVGALVAAVKSTAASSAPSAGPSSEPQVTPPAM